MFGANYEQIIKVLQKQTNEIFRITEDLNDTVVELRKISGYLKNMHKRLDKCEEELGIKEKEKTEE